MIFEIQSIKRKLSPFSIGKLCWFLLVLGLVQLSGVDLVEAETSSLTENVKLQCRAELKCRFAPENLTLVLAYEVDSYFLEGTRYDVLQSILKSATIGDRDVTKAYRISFGLSDLEGMFMIAYQSTVSNGKILVKGLSSSEAIWAFSTTATALKVPLNFIVASALTEFGDTQQFNYPFIGRWETVIKETIANQKKALVTGWLHGPDGAKMTITDGRFDGMVVSDYPDRNLETNILLNFEATLPKPAVEVDDSPSVDSIKASDGKTYRFLGSQWAELLPSGKTGLFARRKISQELDEVTGRKIKKINRKKQKKPEEVDPSEGINTENEKKSSDIRKSKQSLGFFGLFFLLIIIGFSIVGVLKTFEDDLLNAFPETQYIFQLLEEQLDYVAETVKNIIVIINDLINSY